MGWSMPDGREIFSLDDFIAERRSRPDQPVRPDLRPEQARLAERPLHPAAVAGRSGGAGAAVPGAGRHRAERSAAGSGAAADSGAPEAAERGAGAARLLLRRRSRPTTTKLLVPKGLDRATAASLLADATLSCAMPRRSITPRWRRACANWPPTAASRRASCSCRCGSPAPSATSRRRSSRRWRRLAESACCAELPTPGHAYIPDRRVTVRICRPPRAGIYYSGQCRMG